MKTVLGFAWRALVGAIACLVGTMVGGAIAGALALPLPAVPAAADPGRAGGLGLLSCLAVPFGTAPVAWGLAVGSRARWAILALLAYVCMGLNTAIEAAIFTRFGGTAAMLVFNAFIAAFLATGLALLFRSEPLRSW